jgi:hypothetical protein
MSVSRSWAPARFVVLVLTAAVLLSGAQAVVITNAHAESLRDGPIPRPDAEDLDPEETAPVHSSAERAAGSPLARMATSSAEKAALGKLLALSPDNLWGVADSVAQAIEPTWDAKKGVYHTGTAIRARSNAEMLLADANAVMAGHKGATNRPKRIEPLVEFLTGPAWQEHAVTAHGGACPRGGAECWHAMGFVDPGARETMHRSRDAVVMRALAAAWQARNAAGLSKATQDRLYYVVSRTARSAFWMMPKRLENQVNWTADVLNAYTTVTGSDTLIKREYPAQLHWFLSHVHKKAYPGGTGNLSVGMGFHYTPTKPDSYLRNGEDTVEYANITFSALKYFDTARKDGARALSATDTTTLKKWTSHLLAGSWTAGGYPNWDTAHGVGRLHLNQYWLLSLRGVAMGLVGTANEHLAPNQVTVARGLVRQAVGLYQRRAKDVGSPILGPSSYGFYGSELIGDDFDGLTGTARMVEMMTEFARAGLADGATTTLPNGYSHDSQFGRLAITTDRYSSAVVGPWVGLKTGGAEPSRIMDTKSRILTQAGGGYNGTLGLAVSMRGKLLTDTEPGVIGQGVSHIAVPARNKNKSGGLGKGITGTASASGSGILVRLAHRFTAKGVTTTYTVTNRHSGALDAVLRVPTYGNPNGASIYKHKPSVADLRNLKVTTADGGAFKLAFRGIPKGATTKVVTVRGEQSNPTPGAELLIHFKLPKGKMTIQRGIAPQAGS